MIFVKIFNKLDSYKLIHEIFEYFGETGRKNVSVNAASIAFYAFMSIIPILVLLCSQLPFTGITKDELTFVITNITPDSIDSLIESIINEAYSSRVGVFSVSIVFLLWSSSKAMLAMIRAVDKIYDQTESRNYFVMVGFALIYTAAIIILVSLSLILYAKGHSLEEIIADRASGKADFNVVVSQLHYYTALAVMTVVFALICTFAPSGKRKVKFQLPGAFFSSSAIIIFTMFFAMYANGKNIYSSFYGSLSSVAIFLLWIYSCINLFLMGCVINVRYEDKIKIFFSKLVLKK